MSAQLLYTHCKPSALNLTYFCRLTKNRSPITSQWSQHQLGSVCCLLDQLEQMASVQTAPLQRRIGGIWGKLRSWKCKRCVATELRYSASIAPTLYNVHSRIPTAVLPPAVHNVDDRRDFFAEGIRSISFSHLTLSAFHTHTQTRSHTLSFSYTGVYLSV